MTLEEAQAKILELTDENTQLKADKQKLSDDNNALTADNESLRTLNQKYFNRLIAEENEDNNEEEEEGGEDVPTMEDFAKTLTI